MSPQRPSGRRFAAFLAALAVAATAFGALVLPRFADGEVPASLKPPVAAPSVIQPTLEYGRCPHRGPHDPGT
jgi:hypothetical protein